MLYDWDDTPVFFQILRIIGMLDLAAQFYGQYIGQDEDVGMHIIALTSLSLPGFVCCQDFSAPKFGW